MVRGIQNAHCCALDDAGAIGKGCPVVSYRQGFAIRPGAFMRFDRRGIMTSNATFYEAGPLTLRGRYEKCIFRGCVITKLEGNVELVDCVLSDTEFDVPLKDLLHFTLTLNCHSFDNVRFSERMLCAMLFLLTMTQGNLMLRDKISECIPQKYHRLFEKEFKVEV